MTRWHRWSFNILTVILAATGVAYFVMKHLMHPTDPFSVVNHPLQPTMLHLHVLASPIFLLVFGIVFQAHIAWKIQYAGPNRLSGFLSMGCVALVVATGYLLQVVVSPGALRAMLVLHLASSGVFVLAYGTHLVINFLLAREASRHMPEPRFVS